MTDFRASILALARSIKGLPALEPTGEVMLPGEPEVRESERRRSGIPIPAKVWTQLAETAEALGVPLPPTLQ